MTLAPATLSKLRGNVSEWQPKLLAFDDPLLARLVDERQVLFVHDEIRSQIAELVETRDPTRTYLRAELDERVDEFLKGQVAERYGTWVYYPWSGRLVHVLPEEEFREIRTSRNRNKITDDEQQTLRQLKLGIVGLSVGQATALTLALEEIGGEYRLADFDTLSLSNLNRLRAGVHSLAVNKAVVTAREILEINPYARVRVFARGIQDDVVDEFLDGLSILFEECDDLKMKVRLRELAKRRRIPVLMETSDRGLFDVERFDTEPDRPLFHGLTGPLEAERLTGMTTYEKVPIVLRIIGADTMSLRMAASLVDIESSLKTWPQLASAVALGGAINADAARRIALGKFTQSGRFFVDLEQAVADGKAAPIQTFVAEPPKAGTPPTGALAPHVAKGSTENTALALVARGILAPSGGNCQPWRFEYDGKRLRCIHEIDRSRSLLDFDNTASYLAFGMMTTNVDMAAASMGLSLGVETFPDGGDPTLVCEMSFARRANTTPDCSSLLAERVTNRRLGPRTPLSPEHLAELQRTAAEQGATLQVLTTNEELDAVADVLAGGERVRMLSKVMHGEMMHEIRWTPGEAESTRDGLDLATLELTATDLAGLRLVSNGRIMDVLRHTAAGRGLERPTRKAVAAASAVGLLTMDGTTRESFFRGGRALQAVWLAATRCRVAFQPMTALLYMFARLERGNGEGFSESERNELRELRRRFRQVFQVPSHHAELMVFRLFHGREPSARSLRRRPDDVFRNLAR